MIVRSHARDVPSRISCVTLALILSNPIVKCIFQIWASMSIVNRRSTFPSQRRVSKDGRAVWSASVPIAAAPAPGVPVHDHAGDAMTLLTGAAAWARESTLTRILADGRVLDVLPLTFGRARLCVSADVHTLGYDDGW